MIRPYEVLMHAPGVAMPMSELGAQIRYRSSMVDHDRELVIMTVGALTGCRFEWNSHEPLALAAGVRPEVLDHLERGSECDLRDWESALIGYVRELHASASVGPATFEAAHAKLGDQGMVELAATVGYYTMLAYVMGSCDAC
jgi:4-carboxymuconolactone decarboxylase